MPFDPATRKEIWCFLRFRRGKKVITQRLPFIYTMYDNDDTRYLEPVPLSDFYHVDPQRTDIYDPNVNGARTIAGFEFFAPQDLVNLHDGVHGF